VKEFLSREQVSYIEKNVGLDQAAAQEMVNRSKQMGVPVTIINNEVIIGFDQPALRKAITRLRQSKGNNLKLGAQVADAAKVLESLGKPASKGALVGKVQTGSLAEKSGLREGDIITAMEGQAIEGVEDLAATLKRIAAANFKQPTITVLREGRENIMYLMIE
jgi:S1-C subfamily serine protease